MTDIETVLQRIAKEAPFVGTEHCNISEEDICVLIDGVRALVAIDCEVTPGKTTGCPGCVALTKLAALE